jgi:DNA-binding response OmpR family regulator
MLFGRKQRLINRLLIVEDEPLVAFDLENALTHADYTVVATVDRYRDAMAVIESEPLDLILSDVKLTGKRDGVDLARDVKPRGIRLMFVTASCPIDAPELSVGCLAKPYGQRQLLEALTVLEATLRGSRPKKMPPGLSLYGV